MHILVIDIGTSSMRGILYNEAGEQLFLRQIRYRPIHAPDGSVEQSPEDFSGALVQIVKDHVSQGNAIDALALTSQRSSIIPVDRDGEPLMDTIMWQDTRNAAVCRELGRYNDRIASLSGAKVNTVFSGSKMAWVRQERPEIFEKVHKFVNIPEYLMYRMSGAYVTDVTYASRSNLIDLARRVWSPELLEIFGISAGQLCELHEPGEICARTNEAFRSLTGLPAGTPVVSAGGDQQCAAVGQGAYQEGVLSIVAGTGAFLVTTCDGIPGGMDGSVICNCAAVPGKYIAEANVLTCCSAFDWFCGTFYDWPGGTVDYARIDRELEKLYPQETASICLPYFQGRGAPFWNAGARGAFFDISLGATREELLRSLLEGIFMEIGNNIQRLSAYAAVDRAYISGGLTRSRIADQMQADVYGMPLYHMDDPESTAIGALMVALHGLGACPDMEAAFSAVRKDCGTDVYRPDPEKHRRYEEKRKRMNSLYEQACAAAGA